jgi:phosphoesterase RecJ-like protein
LKIVSILAAEKFNRNTLLENLYEQTKEEVKFKAYAQGEMKLDKPPVAYAIMEKGIESKFDLPYELVSGCVYVLKNIKDYPYQVFASYDLKRELYKVSLRSRSKPINPIAKKFGGGGHDFASGIKVKTIEEVKAIIDEVEKLKN